MTQLRSFATLAALFAPAAVFAHPDGIHAATFFDGLSHPLTGLDHLLAMIAVGMTAARAHPSERWVAPASFLAAMLTGSIAGANGWNIPFTEVAIVCSVFLFVAVAMAKHSLPSTVVAPLVGVFALFHGIAHGAEAYDAGAGFMAGMLLTTGALLALGFVISRAKQAGVLRFVTRAREAMHQRADADRIVRN